jgi:hypothetical protein
MIASHCCLDSRTSLARTGKAHHTNKALRTNRDSSPSQIPSPNPSLHPTQIPNRNSPILPNPTRPIRRASRSHRAKARKSWSALRTRQLPVG